MKKHLNVGRPPKPDRENVKRNRTLSFTDKEYQNLDSLSHKAGQTKSEYIIKSLNL